MRIERTARIPLGIYLMLQQKEVDSGLNALGAREEFGHEPTCSEKWHHYLNCGRAEEFAAIHSDDHIFFTGLAACCDPMNLSEEFREALLSAVWDFWQELFARYPGLKNHHKSEGL